MTNTARTTAGNVLRALEASGAVKVTYRRVSILAPDRLRAMLEADAEATRGGSPAKPNSQNADRSPSRGSSRH